MREKVDKLLENANELFLKKKFKDAILLYDEILKLDAENLNVINNKGYALSKIKNYDDAIACYDQGLKINPNEKRKNKIEPKIISFFPVLFLDLVVSILEVISTGEFKSFLNSSQL